jgi:hypothetical protein
VPRNDNLVLEDVRIIFRNFAGAEGMYNRKGDRNFAVVLDRDVAEQLALDGWNVKMLKPRDEDDEPTPYLSVAVNFEGSRPPLIRMITSRGSTDLDVDTVDTLDWVDISQVDLIVRPYDWEVSGRTGRKAYLQSMYITIIEDPLQLKYGNTNQIATVDGPMLERTEMMIKPVDA